MQFVPFVRNQAQETIPVSVEEMTAEDAARTEQEHWQTSWNSDFLSTARLERYAVRRNDELLALAAYEILEEELIVHIVYMESRPDSNPTLDSGKPKYTGIGQLLVAYGIKLSVDNGLTGDVVLEAKTTALAEHYKRDFGAVELPSFSSSAPRLLIADEAAKRIFFRYLQ